VKCTLKPQRDYPTHTIGQSHPDTKGFAKMQSYGNSYTQFIRPYIGASALADSVAFFWQSGTQAHLHKSCSVSAPGGMNSEGLQ
jgi:hypothetical protein